MSDPMNRRSFLRNSLAASAGGALAVGAPHAAAQRGTAAQKRRAEPTQADRPLPEGMIGNLKVSRLLLGGNLLTHFTHSRDLRYVYNLTAHYNTPERIMETMALAERHGINTLVVHNPPPIMETLKAYRRERGGKMRWIICPTAPCEPGMVEYIRQVDALMDAGADAIYLWGVRADQLVARGKIDLMKEAVGIAKAHGVPSGVGAHDLRVVEACEEQGVDADFYIKTLHHHKYPSGPKPDELTKPVAEIPGYWCRDPEKTVRVMTDVRKPWIAFKVMAAGAIPPKDAFPYAVNSGADHILAGMFDFEIAEDAKTARQAFASAKRERPWCS